MRGIVNDPCSMNDGKPCFYCSIEKTTRPYTRIEKDTRTGLFKPVCLGRKTVERGEYCNNACEWVENLHYCPVKWEHTKKGAHYGREASNDIHGRRQGTDGKPPRGGTKKIQRAAGRYHTPTADNRRRVGTTTNESGKRLQRTDKGSKGKTRTSKKGAVKS